MPSPRRRILQLRRAELSCDARALAEEGAGAPMTQQQVISGGRLSALPTADRLARGDEARYLFGQKLPHKLKAAEWPAYEQAKERGYLVTPSGGLARVRLRNCYWHYCSDLGRPFAVTELSQRWASIEMDLIEIPPRAHERAVSWQLSDRAYQQIDALLGEHTKPGAWWSSGHVFVYSSAIPIAVAPWLAERLFTIACTDLRGGK
jgi:hypothetical protein